MRPDAVLLEVAWGLLSGGPWGGTIPAQSILPDLLLRRIPPSLDNSLLHSIETIIIDWSHQIRDVLSKDSAQALLDGLHPLPQVEFEFWDAQLMNLKCIHEQVTPPLHGGGRPSAAQQPGGPRPSQANS